jgi:spore germination protein KC
MRAVKLLACLLLISVLAGCWGSLETDEIAYVMAMGFDRGPGDSLVMTFQIANPRTIAGQAAGGGGGGGGNSQGGTTINISTVASLPIGAFNLLNVERGRKISLQHTRAFIFSDELAREGLHHYLNPLNRYRETRGTAFIYISRGRARDFMEKNQSRLEFTPVKQYELVSKMQRLHSLAPVTEFRKFYHRTKSIAHEPTAPLVAVNEKGLKNLREPEPDTLGDYLAGELPSDKGEAQFLGTAVFKGDKMVGTLTGDETRYLNMLTGEMNQGFLIIDDPIRKGKPVGLILDQARKPDIKVRFSPGRPAIEVDIYQEPEIVGVASAINYESTELKPVLERALAGIIRERCHELVARTQEEFRSDIIGFGRVARRQFLTLQDWEKVKWHEAYPMAGVNINVHVKIRRTGLMRKTVGVHM